MVHGPQSHAYDYVVVGAGSAGCVLANRLSAAPDTDVLLLEAGRPDDTRNVRIPAAFPDLFRTERDWAYETAPQSELDDRRLYWPRGKTLGGSSSLNAMIYVRGHPTDYDRWADLGNDGWAYADVLPAFRRMETFAGSGGEPASHGTDGPLHVTDQRSPRDLSRVFVDAAGDAGYEPNADFNGATQAGVGLYHVTQKDGRRHSVADAYLKPVLGRRSLTAETGAHVTGVRFDGNRAVGVTYEQNGVCRRADAAEAVVLSAGAVNTPQLLMLSGVGPARHLREHDIPVRHHLPGVGRNLQDHLVAFVVHDCHGTSTLDRADRFPALPANLAKLLLRRRGPLTSNIAEAGGFVRIDGDLPAPDLQFHFCPAYLMRHGFDNPETGTGFSLGVTQLRPGSRGRITLRSGDPFEPPTIDPRYLTEPGDMAALVEGLRRAREVVRAGPFDRYRGDERWPGPAVTTEADLADHVRETATTLYHPVGTCRMGSGEEAVVDDRFRVHGVENLRVVDASVIPTLPGGNTNAPVVMLGERAAEFIHSDR